MYVNCATPPYPLVAQLKVKNDVADMLCIAGSSLQGGLPAFIVQDCFDNTLLHVYYAETGATITFKL